MERFVEAVSLFTATCLTFAIMLTGGTGCAVQSSAGLRVYKAQVELGATKSEVLRIVEAYSRGVDRRIAECRGQPTPETRRTCMGPFAPDSQLSKAIEEILPAYSLSAEALAALAHAFETIELYNDRLGLGEKK